MPGSGPTVIFDVGNVLLRWDPRNLYRKIFTNPQDCEWFLGHVCTPAWNLEQDRGRPYRVAIAEKAAEFPEFAREIGLYFERWQEMITGPIGPSVAVLEALKRRGDKVYGLTNFSVETWGRTKARFPFLSLFDGCTVSGMVGLVKPDPAIYHALLGAHGLSARDCVFIDDSEANIATAERLGMTAIHFAEPIDLPARLRAAGVAL